MIVWPEIEKIKSKDNLVIRCDSCGSDFLRQKRVYVSIDRPDNCRHCNSTKRSLDKCVDCGNIIYRGSLRCKKCYGKTISIDRNNCLDCGVKVKCIKSKRCLSCHNRKQDKGKSTERVKFNASKKWATLRNECFERDSYTCQHCNKLGGTLNAHHIKTWAKHPDLRLDINNLVTLCLECHREVHGLNRKGNKNENSI